MTLAAGFIVGFTAEQWVVLIGATTAGIGSVVGAVFAGLLALRKLGRAVGEVRQEVGIGSPAEKAARGAHSLIGGEVTIGGATADVTMRDEIRALLLVAEGMDARLTRIDDRVDDLTEKMANTDHLVGLLHHDLGNLRTRLDAPPEVKRARRPNGGD